MDNLPACLALHSTWVVANVISALLWGLDDLSFQHLSHRTSVLFLLFSCHYIRDLLLLDACDQFCGNLMVVFQHIWPYTGPSKACFSTDPPDVGFGCRPLPDVPCAVFLDLVSSHQFLFFLFHFHDPTILGDGVCTLTAMVCLSFEGDWGRRFRGFIQSSYYFFCFVEWAQSQ